MGEYQKVFTQASLMGIRPEAAVRMRTRYLSAEFHELMRYKKSEIAMFWAREAVHEIMWLADNVKKRATNRYTRTDDITDADIEIAKQFPVTQLVEFRNHKAEAFCHVDRRPSLYYASRINRVACPVCNKYFNAIDICMDRDSMTFIETIKFLRGR